MPKPYFKPTEQEIQSIIRVDHAGEYGAKLIYEGQLEATVDDRQKQLIAHMLAGELVHLDFFSQQIKNGVSRPTLLMPIWQNFAYLLGKYSAKLGDKYAMLVTDRVEEVIVQHYCDQIDRLAHNPEFEYLRKTIEQFKNEEQDHQHIAQKEGSRQAKFEQIFSQIVKFICYGAIVASKKI